MARSAIIAIGLMVLGLSADMLAGERGPGPSTTASADEHRQSPHEAEALGRQGDVDGTVELFSELLNHDLTMEGPKVITARIARWGAEKEEAPTSTTQQPRREPPVPGRYRLVGESGWVFLIDTATGEVLGMPVGSTRWQRLRGASRDDAPPTPSIAQERSIDLSANEPDHRPVCIINSDGTGLHAIVDMGKGRYAGSPRMSPDSNSIAFDVWTPATDEHAASAKIYIVDTDGGQPTDIGIGSMPSWVPNGQQITFFRHGGDFGLWRINRDGTLAKQLNGNGNSPRWSPDGKHIAFVRLGMTGGVAILDPESGNERLVTPSRLPSGHMLDYRHGLDWSPDGTRLCVQCAVTPDNMEIRLIDVQTGAITVRLSQQTGHSLSWFPNAAKILFWMKGPDDQFNQLYVLNPDTNDPPERVAGQPRDRDNTDASWSPDGTRITFTSGMPSR